jgi:hypothetical protein
MWPNLILGGAPKSGTSSLYFWLDAHPDVGSSKAKEPFFFFDKVNRFNEKANVHEHGFEAYPKLFVGQESKKIVFEASAPYIYSPTALKFIPQIPTKPKVLFLLREPAARLLSKYRFNRYKLHNPTGEFKEYCTANRGSFPSGIHADEGHYHHYLKEWKKNLAQGQLSVLLMEDMMQDPRKFMKSLCEWLEIDPSFYDNFSFERHNETFTTRSGSFHKKAVSWLPLIPEFLKAPLSKVYRSVNSTKMPDVSEEEKRLTAELKEYYRADRNALLEDFPHLPLDLWK